MENQELLQAIRQIVKEEVSAQVDPVKQDISGVKQEITKINIRLENDVDKRLQLLAEGQQGMNEKFQKLDQVAEDVEEIKLTTRALEAVTQRNSNDIRSLRAVK